MKTIGEILRLSTDHLQKKSIDRARRQVEELLSHVLKIPRIELYLQFDKPLVEEELSLMREYLKRRLKGEPVQYICGSTDFLSCHIQVTQDVLIPRPETEILVDRVIKELPKDSVEVWDLCTGSGCIGIAVKKKRPDCRVALVDIFPKALEVAKRNANVNRVDVEIVQGDLLTPLAGRRGDVVICNPPYISEVGYNQLDPEVREWEPKIALVGGETGFEFYERLAADLPRYLKPGAKVYFEIGRGMGEGLKKIFGSSIWKNQELLQDWSSHDRYYKLELEQLL